jgi:transposase
MKNLRFIGLDVHAESIAVAVAQSEGEVRSLGSIPNRPESVARLIKKLGKPESLRACYEAGPTGYVLYWQLCQLGVHCDVIAPSLIPVKAGDRVKTDRRDAQKLARCYRAGDLTPVWVPDQAHEALRDLVRTRLCAKRDELRARNRLSKFLLRHGRRAPAETSRWTEKHLAWIRKLSFEQLPQQLTVEDYLHEVEHQGERIARLERCIDQAITTLPRKMQAVIQALQSLRGIAQVSAVSIMAELGVVSRFAKPRQLMGYAGVVSWENSSGTRVRRGGISKAGNSHLRRIVGEAAWCYRHRPAVGKALALRQRGSSAAVNELAWKAQHRLHQRYLRLSARGKCKQQAVTAVARELLGFIWAIGIEAEQAHAVAALPRAA